MASDEQALPAFVTPSVRMLGAKRPLSLWLLWKHAPSLFIGAARVLVIAIGALFAPALGPADPIQDGPVERARGTLLRTPTGHG